MYGALLFPKPTTQVRQRGRQGQSPSFDRQRSRGPERLSSWHKVAQECVNENTDVGLPTLDSLYKLDKHVSVLWLVRARAPGGAGKLTSREQQVLPGGFSGLGAQPSLQNICFLFSFYLWLRAENRVFLSGRASKTWLTTS